MSIFQEAARLADKTGKDLKVVGVTSRENLEQVVDLLRTIAALEAVSVKPVGYINCAQGQDIYYTPDQQPAQPGFWSDPVYTQQALEAAVLKDHDTAIEKAAEVADEVAQRNAGSGNKADYRASILALKCNYGGPAAMAQYATNGWTNTAILPSRMKP